MTAPLDPRLHAYRPDLADEGLRGKVEAGRFSCGTPRRVRESVVGLWREPRSDAPRDSELVFGETVRVFDTTDEGWAWVQADMDGYVGYAPLDALGEIEPVPNRRVTALSTYVYSGPNLRFPTVCHLPMGVLVAVEGKAETRGTAYSLLAGGAGAIVTTHLGDPAEREADFVEVAERFVGVPYLWAGRSAFGLDCSALVQIALAMTGVAAPRDSDMQASMGEAIDLSGPFRRGDLIFWEGHVGIMRDEHMLLHANGNTMDVANEPLGEAVERIARLYARPTCARRLSQ